MHKVPADGPSMFQSLCPLLELTTETLSPNLSLKTEIEMNNLH